MVSVDEIIRQLALQPHPEGGYYRETFRDSRLIDGRAYSTAIYFLLRQGEISRWHRIDAVEMWHWYAGDPLVLSICENGGNTIEQTLGSHLERGEQPQIVVPADAWQTAQSLGAYTLVGCTVAPGFEFSRFELAPQGWSPYA
jgi:predicted cupin superfamily sugar epimerase